MSDPETMYELKRVVSDAIREHGRQRAADFAGCDQRTLYRILRSGGRNTKLSTALNVAASMGLRWVLVRDDGKN
jgi:DNA-binding phage protein